jgi:hypothetical protein
MAPISDRWRYMHQQLPDDRRSSGAGTATCDERERGGTRDEDSYSGTHKPKTPAGSPFGSRATRASLLMRFLLRAFPFCLLGRFTLGQLTLGEFRFVAREALSRSSLVRLPLDTLALETCCLLARVSLALLAFLLVQLLFC